MCRVWRWREWEGAKTGEGSGIGGARVEVAEGVEKVKAGEASGVEVEGSGWMRREWMD